MPAKKTSASRQSHKTKSVKSSPASSKAKATFSPFDTPTVFTNSTPKNLRKVGLHLVRHSKYDTWLHSQNKTNLVRLKAQDWVAKPGTIALLTDDEGLLERVYVGVADAFSLYTLSYVVDALQRNVPQAALKQLVFEIAEHDLTPEELVKACAGWGLACYSFDAFKANHKPNPLLIWPASVDRNQVEATVTSITLIRNLINLPANALGPAELTETAEKFAKSKKAKIRVVEDKALVKENFPLIYAVGDGSERRPRLIDITWGNPSHPKVTLVGKGVCFDTGGYDLKPSSAMLLMKKDMGGAAMALGLAWMITSLQLPVRLRVLIPAVENSVSGRAFRPMDILSSRKGLTVEIGNTDAEGRLVMADCLTLACEESPDLLMDFSTLTGAARSALGWDIPAMYSNNTMLAHELQEISLNHEDPLWQLPLWQGYKSDIVSPNADLTNSGNNPAGSITAALFLESFVDSGIDWIHIDHYAWEQSGKPGRPRGGADTGMRAVLELLKQRYGEKSKKRAAA